MTDARPEHRAAVHDLGLAIGSGHPLAVAALLDPSVTLFPDGAESISGIVAVEAWLSAAIDRFGAALDEGEVNGQAGLVLRGTGRVLGVICVDVRDRLVTDLWVVQQPDKLLHWNREAAPTGPPE